MIGRLFTLAMLTSFGMAETAAARAFPDTEPSPRAMKADAPTQLAQSGEVELYYDRYGREVLVDVYTGEVISIREPQGSFRRFEEPPRGIPQQDRYYLDDPDDMARLRRERRMEELNRQGYPPPDFNDYPAQPAPEPGYEDFARQPPPYDDRGFGNPWPNDPVARQDPPNVRGGNQIERAPLDNSSVAVIPDPNAQDSIIDGMPPQGTGVPPQGPGALPDVTQQPEIVQKGATENVAKIQILLGRSGAHPGVIDGRIGDNVNKAITAYRELTGETLRTYDTAYVDAALAASGGDAFTSYEITPVDVAGPFVASVPTDYGEKAKMDRLGFVSVAEMLAERFHMDENYLRALNPGLSFDRPGTIIRVANVGKPRTGVVTRIVADKGRRQVRAYGEDGKLIAVYPSTIGSAATPSPTGTHTVQRIALDPQYTYNPKINFKQGDNDRVLTIPPGPNGPVGTVWIALSKPTYGIHGTPDPSKIGKTESNGCIRLTNWNAQELAKMVKAGTVVEFVE